MSDHPVSVHPPPPFDYGYYDDPVFQAAAEAAKARSRGHCQKCGRKRPLEAHHWTTGPYPPANKTTADDLTVLCRDCHDEAHDFRFFLDAGGAPEKYLAALSELVAILVRPADGRQVGRAVWFEGEWGALVTGGSKPCVDEAFSLFLRSKRAWRDVVVTEVVDGWPGHWRVRKQFLDRSDEVLRTAA